VSKETEANVKLSAPWGEILILLIALPALLSPVIVIPFSQGVSPDLVRALHPLISICEYPRAWALAASVVACLWVWRAHVSWQRKAVGVGIAALSWIPALYTAGTIAAWSRF
jgi:hypothetical protein